MNSLKTTVFLPQQMWSKVTGACEPVSRLFPRKEQVWDVFLLLHQIYTKCFKTALKKGS